MAMDYEKDVNIDPQGLDVEWLRQGELMGKYTRHSAETEKAVDIAKEALDAGKSRIEMDIRMNPDKYGLAKITEGAVQSLILLEPEYKTLSEEYIEAKYDAKVAQGAVRAIDHKKTSLENLVMLLGRAYFAGPKAPRDLGQEWVKEGERKAENKKVKIRRRTGESE